VARAGPVSGQTSDETFVRLLSSHERLPSVYPADALAGRQIRTKTLAAKVRIGSSQTHQERLPLESHWIG
jgi:hypothetical protein